MKLAILWLASTVMGEIGAYNMGRWWGEGPAPLAKRTNPLVRKILYCLINMRTYTNSVMVVIITHIADITCLLTNDGWHAYDVIGVYKLHHGAGRILYFAESTILSLAGRVMGEVGSRNI